MTNLQRLIFKLGFIFGKVFKKSPSTVKKNLEKKITV